MSTSLLRGLVDITQITLTSELLSQIRGLIVVLWDRIHKELGNQIDYRNQS